MDLKQRLRNKTFIVSLIAFVVLIIKTFTHYQLPENFDTLVNMGLSLLTGLGILIDPTTEGINDSKPSEQVQE